MAELLQRFSGNPFSTPVGQKIDRATDIGLTTEDWGLNMEICDLINETEDGARDAIRAIKKRLQQTTGKNFTVFMLTLTVLETCVKNCGKRFHIFVANKDFIQELIKLIGPKNSPPQNVQNKVLGLIQSWAEAFQGQPELQGVSVAINELRGKGFDFPKSSDEPKVPIHTPSRSTGLSCELSSSPPSKMSTSPKTTMDMPQPIPPANRQPNVAYPIDLNFEQMNKLKVDLDIVQENMKLLSQMLTELKPGSECKDDIDLLVELFKTCQSMQKRIVDLIEQVANEEVTNELLRINDELNNLFMRYDRYMKKRNHSCEQMGQDISMMPSTSDIGLMPSSSTSEPKPQTNVASLIDFTDDEPDGLAGNLKNLEISQPSTSVGKSTLDKKPAGDEFDMFAQSRSTTNQTTKDLLDLDPVPSSEADLPPTDVQEIETWLSNSTDKQFEQFLERRSTALEQQPPKKSPYNEDTSLI